MGFDAGEKHISDLFSNQKSYGIPRNQRKYVWDKTNWSDLFSDFAFLFNNHPQNVHFLGTVVLQRLEKKPAFESFLIIDGQQRSITLLMLLAAILHELHVKGRLNEFEGLKRFLISTDLQNQSHSIIQSESNPAVSKIIESISNYNDNPEEIINKIKLWRKNNIDEALIYDCFLYFNEIFHNMKIEDALRYRDLILDSKYVDVSADSEEDSYTIFEILNARGQKLEDHEMIKNYIMRYIVPQQPFQIDIVKDRWNKMERGLRTPENMRNFFRHYLTHKVRNTSKDGVFKTFKDSVKKDNINVVFDDVELKSGIYISILYPKSYENLTDVEKFVFDFFNRKRSVIFRPLFLSLRHRYLMEEMSQELYEEVILKIYYFFIAYNVIAEEKSNKIDNLISKHSSQIENNFSEQTVNDFLKDLDAKFPDEDMFMNAFSNIGWSNHNPVYKDNSHKNRVKTILEAIEWYYRKRPDIEIGSLEHMLPDADGGNNHLIGNIIPLEKDLNDKCKDQALSEKLPHYSHSSYCFPHFIVDRYGRPESPRLNVKDRTRLLGEQFYFDVLGRFK